jgi:hypothetical protein
MLSLLRPGGIYHPPTGIWMYHDVSGFPPFWDLETIITKKNGFIYLTYLENPSPGKEMQVGTLPMI